jgi:endonuclease/exonuclease/phosphatase (EEP) superfamily protein YafD
MNSFVKKISFIGRGVFWTFWQLVALAMALLYPLHWATGESLKPVRMIFYVMPWVTFLAALILAVALWRRRKWLSLTLAIPILIFSFNSASLFLPNRSVTPPPGGLSLSIMSYNMHGSKDIGDIVAIIQREKPDILLIQEYPSELVSSSFHDLDDLYPYMDETDPFVFGQAAFSRYPIDRSSADFNEGRTQKLSIVTPAGIIAVWNVHPLPPFLISPEEYDAQMSMMASDISATSGPLIVAGDFNATDQTVAYHEINRYLKDAYRERGWGFGFTYPAPPFTLGDLGVSTGPLWRIDYVFYNEDFIAVSARILTTAGGSDHFPLTAELYYLKRK